MPRCSAAGLDFTIIPAGFNAPLEFLTGFTIEIIICLNFGYSLRKSHSYLPSAPEDGSFGMGD
jgi:hypothetical protein